MSKAAHIDIEDLKTKTPEPRMTVADFPNRDAAFEYLLGKIDSLNDKIAKLEAKK